MLGRLSERGRAQDWGVRLTAFTLRSAAAAAWVRRSSGDCGRCRGPRCSGLPLLSMVNGGARVCPPVSADDLEQRPPISRDRVQSLYLKSEEPCERLDPTDDL
jgi:hypothetical protein